MMHKVLLIHPTIQPEGIKILEGSHHVCYAPDGDEQTLIAAINQHSTHAMIVRVEFATKAIFEHCPTLGIVGMHGVGTDTIDVPAATAAGILVMHTPWVNYQSTAEHTLALMLAVSKKILPGHAAIQRGAFVRYRNTHLPLEMEGKVLFIIGVGRIGGEMARKCRSAFHMHILGIDPAYSPEQLADKGVTAVDFATGLAAADVVTIHTPLNTGTRQIMNAQAFAQMKRGAIFINAARGGVMDSRALMTALDDGHLAGAGLDVFDPEPVPMHDPIANHDKIVMTPHFAGDTVEARKRCSETIARSISDALNGFPLEGLVNPEVLSLPQLRLRHCLARPNLRERA